MALAFLRQHQRWFHVLLGLVILGFIFFGPTTMFTDTNAAGTPAEEVGRVGELPISARDYQSAYSRLRAQYQSMYSSGGGLDPRMLRMLGIEQQAFDQLVNERVIELEARRLGLYVSDRDIAQMVSSHPAFQDSNGGFIGAAGVRNWAESRGMSLDDFEKLLRRDILREQLEALVTDAVTVTPGEVEEKFRRDNEEAKLEYVLVDSTALASKLAATGDEARGHFEANKETYRVPETRVASYVVVDIPALRAQLPVTDNDITRQYEATRDTYREREQICARQVLVEVKEGRTEEQARKMAENLAAELRGGADFAALAKKSSDDAGTKDIGGDLDCFERGRMPNEFENVAFNMKAGQISDPVRTTQYGYHVIQVKEARPERVRPLEEVKEQIKQQLSTDKARAEAERLKAVVAQGLSEGRKLADMASANGLKVETSQALARGEQTLPFTEQVIGRLFEMKLGETLSEPQSVPTGFLFVSLAETKPSRVPELSEVEARVKTDVVQKKALEQAQARAAELKQKAGAGLAKAASAMGLTRKETPSAVKRDAAIGDLPKGAAVEAAAFSLPVGQLSDPIPVRNGYVVLRVTERKAADPAELEKQKGQIAAGLRATKRGQMFQAFMAQARERIPIQRHPDVLARIAG